MCHFLSAPSQITAFRCLVPVVKCPSNTGFLVRRQQVPCFVILANALPLAAGSLTYRTLLVIVIVKACAGFTFPIYAAGSIATRASCFDGISLLLLLLLPVAVCVDVMYNYVAVKTKRVAVVEMRDWNVSRLLTGCVADRGFF